MRPDHTTIGTLKGRIADLNQEIVKLETENGQKVAQALELRNEHQQRMRILELFTALTGRPVMGDARLKELSDAMRQIEVDRTALQVRIEAHATRRRALERDLVMMERRLGRL